MASKVTKQFWYLKYHNFGIQSTNFGIRISLLSINVYVLLLKDEKGSKLTPPTLWETTTIIKGDCKGDCKGLKGFFECDLESKLKEICYLQQ
jgi:hypothetical protein